MAVYDKDFQWTKEADALDNELRIELKPILERAIENGLTVEDVHYIVGNYVFEELISTVLWERSKIEKNRIKE